jgi:hypothetical protein
MKRCSLTVLGVLLAFSLWAQFTREAIHTDVVLYNKRQSFDHYLREKVINEAFAGPLDSNTEYLYESACLSVTQFTLQSPQIKAGLDKMFARYDSLEYRTKRALLETVYGVYPAAYTTTLQQLLLKETVPKLFAMEALYLYRQDASLTQLLQLQTLLKQRFPAADTVPLLAALQQYLALHQSYTQQPVPPLTDLLEHQSVLGQKIIYSFQRWNRDYPGLAIVQYADGHFARDGSGQLLVFQQLARSASNLPYFITNGNTPQGIYSIQGAAVVHNNFLGPTPTLQMVLPFEADSIYWHTPYDSTRDALANYLQLLPPSWQSYAPMTEAFYAGQTGRSEIIAHGTTLNPEYFKGQPYYPLTPTLGCLCAKEVWNEFNGSFLHSDQFNLVNTFLATPGDTGYLMVINLDNQDKAVAREELEKWVLATEKKLAAAKP